MIIYDKPFNRRLAFRAEHLRKVPEKVKSGVITSCGPVFEDETKSRFLGSSFTIQAESRSQVLSILKEDIYAQENVWDFDNVVIHPYSPYYRSRQDVPQ